MTRLLPVGWLLMLAAPALSVFAAVESWDFAPEAVLAVSGYFLAGGLLLLSPRAFYWGSLPLQWFGLVAIAARMTRNVDLLELALQIRTIPADQIRTALAPSLLPAAGLAVVLALLAFACVRAEATSPRPLSRGRAVAFVLALGAGLALWVPGMVWLRAWPMNAIAVAVAATTGASALDNVLFPRAGLSDPRPPQATWHAQRTATPPGTETYVLVIGESVRADALRECGAPPAMPPLRPDVLVACDVTAGADATHASVPLMVSRDLPGIVRRVPADATFLKAFEQAGFHTYWLTMQEASIVWPDAQTLVELGDIQLDRPAFAERLDSVLADGHPRRAVVLHTVDAHIAYCSRFSSDDPHPFHDDCAHDNGEVSPATLPKVKAAYGNAVAASMAFLDRFMARLEREPGAVFLVYSPDHGEAFLDDRRQLYGHAMIEPTRWDIQVPAVFWANAAWRAAHPQAWQRLAANRGAPLMHADLVPTLLGAAGIQYEDRRDGVFDLTSKAVPTDRERIVHRNFGKTTTWRQLVEAAR
ncbi:MAG: sulfatase-like hydrolase/transferase [Mitsuaria chitosanitabida]|nr:sulfatase-like hydrolase/transferase [Roseateles chitosanitabidus]